MVDDDDDDDDDDLAVDVELKYPKKNPTGRGESPSCPKNILSILPEVIDKIHMTGIFTYMYH